MDKINIIHQIRVNDGIDKARFGMSIDELQALGYREMNERYNEITQWSTFAQDENLLCYVKDAMFVAFACFEKCHLCDIDLIGLNEYELVAVLGEPTERGGPLWVSDNQQQIPFEYEKEGLQVWFQAGKVISIFGDEGS